MKIGVLGANTGSFATPGGAATLTRAAEAAGIESLWTAEHVLWPDDYDSAYPYAETAKMPGPPETLLPDPFVWLAWCAAHSQSLGLATGIAIVPHRHPAIMAKEVATLDFLSGGRAILGIGVGWLREEFEALGVPFSERGKRTDEYVDVMRRLWSTDSVTVSGEFVNFSRMHSNPPPVRGSVPLGVGGHSPAAARRAGRIGDGFAPLGGNVPELIDIMRQTADAAGRDPGTIEITSTHDGLKRGDPEEPLGLMKAWGVDRVLLPAHRLARGDVAENCQTWVKRIEGATT